MLAKRIIPCLDVKDGRTVKGIHFENLRDAGDPVALAAQYAAAGADELVFLDISATEERRKTLLPLVERVARRVDIPFTVGGGIAAVDDVAALLHRGADKVAINTAAVRRPELIDAIATRFGQQCLVVAIDAKQLNGQWKVHLVGGKQPTALDLFQWAREAATRGAGEILFTSMEHDGTQNGFANAALATLSETLPIPVIASGGAGTAHHFIDAFTIGKADAALAASIFHFDTLPIPELKHILKQHGIAIRTIL